eukprot:753399-Hanusia_phi.AAC.4
MPPLSLRSRGPQYRWQSSYKETERYSKSPLRGRINPLILFAQQVVLVRPVHWCWLSVSVSAFTDVFVFAKERGDILTATEEFRLNPSTRAAVYSSFYLGWLFGDPFFGWIADKWGRQGGADLVAYVHCIELSSVQQRATSGSVMQHRLLLFFRIGAKYIPVWDCPAYFVVVDSGIAQMACESIKEWKTKGRRKAAAFCEIVQLP